ncbi:MAG: hypothetical protein ACR2M0_02615 [Chloroflexia bacterium]
MKQMKQFVLAMTILFVSVMGIWAAYRLSPETWAMIAGVVFGLLASLPMCGIVMMLLMRGQRHDSAGRPPEPVYYPPQQPMIWVQPRPMPIASRTFVDRAPAPYPYQPPQPWADAPQEWVAAEAYDASDGYAWEAQAPAWEQPSRSRDPRILGH